MQPFLNGYWPYLLIIALILIFLSSLWFVSKKDKSKDMPSDADTEKVKSTTIAADHFKPKDFFSKGCYVFMFLWGAFEEFIKGLKEEEINTLSFEIEECDSPPSFVFEEDKAYIFTRDEALALVKHLLEKFHGKNNSSIHLRTQNVYYIFFGESRYNAATIKMEYSNNIPGSGWTLNKLDFNCREEPFIWTFRKKILKESGEAKDEKKELTEV